MSPPPGLAPADDAFRMLLPLKECPVAASLRVLSRRWALVIMRDAIFFETSRFTGFMRRNPGMTRRMLSQRLADLVEEGLLERIRDGKDVRYVVTPKGADVAPVLVALFHYGIRHRADEVFHDARPRRLQEAVSVDARPVEQAFHVLAGLALDARERALAARGA